jgi:hypothetical protein
MNLGVNNKPGIDEMNSCRHLAEARLVKIPSFKCVVVPLGHMRIFIRNATVLEVYNQTSTLWLVERHRCECKGALPLALLVMPQNVSHCVVARLDVTVPYRTAYD